VAGVSLALSSLKPSALGWLSQTGQGLSPSCTTRDVGVGPEDTPRTRSPLQGGCLESSKGRDRPRRRPHASQSVGLGGWGSAARALTRSAPNRDSAWTCQHPLGDCGCDGPGLARRNLIQPGAQDPHARETSRTYGFRPEAGRTTPVICRVGFHRCRAEFSGNQKIPKCNVEKRTHPTTNRTRRGGWSRGI
jgi:hypothetical protein